MTTNAVGGSEYVGVEGNEITDGWAKQAAGEPDTRGVEWHRYIDRCGRKSAPSRRFLCNDNGSYF